MPSRSESESSAMRLYETRLGGQPFAWSQLRAGVAFSVLTFIFLIVAFASPYWLQSWPRLHSKFTHMGLWEACLAGFMNPADPEYKAYYGCWWIFSSEYVKIRYWLFPGWFIVVEICALIALCASLMSVALHCWAFLRVTRPQEHKPMQEAHEVKRFVRYGYIAACITGSFQTAVVLIFGVATRVDWNYMGSGWIPMQWLNYLSWSFGLAVVAASFAFFGAIGDYIYMMRLENLRPQKNFEVSSSVSSYLVRKI